ncbi:MAG: GNAT family N-acetyltransferase [Thermoflexales bacterium]|nr:GNAT family N-acetyltransferase [Thermoflexales bacterium]
MNLITVLNARTAHAYAPLTYPHFRPLLDDFASFQDSTLAVGYAVAGKPIGLALAQRCADCEAVHVRSVFVRAAYRGKGIGTALLQRLESEVAASPYTRLHVEYPHDRPETAHWEQVLARCGWQAPQFTYLRCAVIGQQAVAALLAAPWIQHAPPLPDGAELFDWHELSAAEQQRLEAQQTTEHYGDGLEPVMGERPYEPLNSLGVRYRGEVIGWMLTIRTAPGRVLYDRLFMDERFRHTGCGATLLAESIKRQYAQDGHRPDVGGVWRTLMANRPMVVFIKHRLKPYLTSLVEFSTSYKELN